MKETKRKKTLITAWKNLFHLQLPIDTGSYNNCFISSCLLKSTSLCLGEREDSQEKVTDFHTGIYIFLSQINKHDGLQWAWFPCNDNFSF